LEFRRVLFRSTKEGARFHRVLDAGLERGETLRLPLFEHLRVVADVGIDADLVARRSAEQFVNRHTEEFAFDVPERLLDAAEHTGEDRPASIESVTVNRLPVMDDIARVFAGQIRRDLFDGAGAGPGAA